MTRHFVAGNVWLLVSLTLLVGKMFMRSDPTRYAFFGGGAWFSPAQYGLLVLACAAVGVTFLIISWRRTNN